MRHVRHYDAAFAGMPDYMHRALLSSYLQTAAHHPLSNEALDVYSAPWLGHIGQPAFYRQIAQMEQAYTDEVEPLYDKISCPVQVLWGVNDDWIPYAKGQELAERISDRPCQLIEGAGHLVQEDRPEAILAAVLHMLLHMLTEVS